MHFSLSPIGFVLAIGLLLPNILFFLFFPPKNIPAISKKTPWFFVVSEKVGQIGCLFLLTITRNPVEEEEINSWLLLSFLFLILYNFLWVRYIRNGREYRFLTKSFLFMPIPLAILPCCIFVVTAIWGHSISLGIATILFTIGHLKVSLDIVE